MCRENAAGACDCITPTLVRHHKSQVNKGCKQQRNKQQAVRGWVNGNIFMIL
jgi:hypothetical protein